MRRALLAITGLAASISTLVVLKGSPEATQIAQDLPIGTAPAVPGSAGPEPVEGEVDAVPSPTAPPRPRPTAAQPRPVSGQQRPLGLRRYDRKPSAPRTTTKPPPSRPPYGHRPIVTNGTATSRCRSWSPAPGSSTCGHWSCAGDRGSDENSSRVNVRTAAAAAWRCSAERQLDPVSGAPTTSNSSKQSLQAAIDRAN